MGNYGSPLGFRDCTSGAHKGSGPLCVCVWSINQKILNEGTRTYPFQLEMVHIQQMKRLWGWTAMSFQSWRFSVPRKSTVLFFSYQQFVGSTFTATKPQKNINLLCPNQIKFLLNWQESNHQYMEYVSLTCNETTPSITPFQFHQIPFIISGFFPIAIPSSPQVYKQIDGLPSTLPK